MIVVWMIVVVIATELTARAAETLWPAIGRHSSRYWKFALLFLTAGLLAFAAGLDLFVGIPRNWHPEVRVAATSFLAGVLTASLHNLIDAVHQNWGKFVQGQRITPATAATPREIIPCVSCEQKVAASHPVRSHARVTQNDAGGEVTRAEADPAREHVSSLQIQLRALGFLGRSYRRGVYCAETDDAVAAYQKHFALVEDGLAGPVTLDHLQLPRCGRPTVRRAELYGKAASEPCRWKNQTVYWSLLSYPQSSVPGQLTVRDVKAIVAEAFETWRPHCKLTFLPADSLNPADIRIEWCSNSRMTALGVPGFPLGYGFAPCDQLPGRVLITSDRTWTAAEVSKMVLHEIGHAIGAHHGKPEDIMWDFPLQTDGQLSAADIGQIENLYA